jgi:hypothetical protein
MMDEKPSAASPQGVQHANLLLAAFLQAGQAGDATPCTIAPVVTCQLLAAHLLQPRPAAITCLQIRTQQHATSVTSVLKTLNACMHYDLN